jgi:hypothetical protein
VYIKNQFFELGEVSKCYKESKIIPIYKKGIKENPENYRPVTIILISSKIFENAP